MNNEERQPSPLSPAGSAQDDPLRRIRHDVRHSLYVLDLGLSLLTESRTDEERFSEVVQMLRNEQATINTLTEELLALVSGNNSKTTAGRQT